MNKIEWIFFDVGSTLMNEEIPFKRKFEEISKKANVLFEEVYEKAIEFYKDNKKGDIEVARVYNVDYGEWDNTGEYLYSEALDSLKQLASKYKIGIIANQPPGTDTRLKESGIMDYISLVISSAEEGVKKPDERIFKRALEKGKCKAENSIMVGDRIDNDIIPAKKLGFSTIWIKQGLGGTYWKLDEEEKKQIDYIVSSLDEIVTLLARNIDKAIDR